MIVKTKKWRVFDDFWWGLVQRGFLMHLSLKMKKIY